MRSFPTEVYHRVFIQLDLNERLKCMLVCRTWWRVLDKHSLLYNVKIQNSPDRFLAFKNMLEHSPHRAAQVQELSLFKCLDPSFNKRQLANMFPNARVMNVEFGLKVQKDGISEPINVTHSKASIKYLYDGRHCELASQIMTSNLCYRLHMLVLNFIDKTSVVFPSQLKNMPVLKTLSVSFLTISVSDLEILHQNVPSLQHMTLSNVSLVLCNRPPFDIIPAHSVTTLDLSIRKVSQPKTPSRVYQYMAIKYPNITDVQHEYRRLHQGVSRDNKLIYVKGIFGIIHAVGCASSQRLSLQKVPHNTNIFTLLEYIDSRSKCWKSIAYKNNKLSTCLLGVIEPQSITTLTLDDGGTHTPDILPCMTQLTKLKLTSDSINLTNYINACSNTLEHLIIYCSILTIGPSNIRPSSIKSLDVKLDMLDKDICKTIPSCFPKLLELKLEIGQFDYSRIDIPRGHPLKEMVIITERSIPHGFTLTSVIGTSYYLCGRGWTKETGREEIDKLCVLSVVSPAEYKMELNGNIIKMVRI